jgi:hypothetical protein
MIKTAIAIYLAIALIVGALSVWRVKRVRSWRSWQIALWFAYAPIAIAADALTAIGKAVIIAVNKRLCQGVTMDKRKSWLSPAGYIETGRFFFLAAVTTYGIGVLTPLMQGVGFLDIIPTGVICVLCVISGFVSMRKGNQ